MDSGLTFGRYVYSDWFNHNSTNYQGPLPTSPPKAGTVCYCPECITEGWFDGGPLCRFWGAHCELCQGTRQWFDRSDRKHKPCDICQENWTAAVREFRDTIGTAAHRARVQAYFDGHR